MLGRKLGDLDGNEFGTYDASELLSSECFTRETVDGEFEGLLLQVRLGSVVGLEFGRFLVTTFEVLDGLLLGKYVGIEVG